MAIALLAAGIMAVFGPAKAEPVFIGPANPGAENGFDHWLYGTTGAGSVVIDTNDPASGSRDFKIGITNAVAGATNKADFRCEQFPLGDAAGGRNPMVFSFAYKFPEEISGNEKLAVYLRFFDATGDVFLNQRIIPVGPGTDGLAMTGYKSVVMTNIYAPKKAQRADIWVTANIFGRWTSGVGEFDDFSLTTVPKRPWLKPLVISGLGFCLIIVLMTRRRFVRRKRVEN